MGFELTKDHERICCVSIAKAPKGPWTNEPHRLNWKHAGLDCMIVRNPTLLNLCGYVGVPKLHLLFGKECNEVHGWGEYETPRADIDVHGGLTYSKECFGSICHDSPQEVWWFGFDCAHCDDLVPGMMIHVPMEEGLFYRDFRYVKSETERLAEQLAGVQLGHVGTKVHSQE